MPSSACKKKLLDRKSTRLNSSHGSISYAVFCLQNQNICLQDKEVVVSGAGAETLGGKVDNDVRRGHQRVNQFCILYVSIPYFFFLMTGRPEISRLFPDAAPFG